MKKSIFAMYVLPFFQWYGLLITMAIIIDYFLHRFQFISVGRYLGVIGTLTIILSFIYSLRKRKIINEGSPKKLLLWHEYLSWTGAVMILVHAGIHFNALLPWLAIVMLLITVASGLIGKFILKKASDTLKLKKQELSQKGVAETDVNNQMFFDSVTVDLMKKWRTVHMPITLVLGILSLIHIITIVMFNK